MGKDNLLLDENGDELLSSILAHRMTRLELMKRGGVTALMTASLGALLAACGGDDEAEGEAGGGEPSAVSDTETAAPPASASEPPAVPSGTLNYFSWQGYDFAPDESFPTMAAWKKENGVTINATYIATNEDVPAKVKGGGGEGLDVTTYGQGFSDFWYSIGIMSELDEERLPNLANLFPFFAGEEGGYWVKDGKRIGVPTFWGKLGLTYDSKEFSTAPTSYDVLLDPKYKGKVLVIEDVWGIYVQVARMLGYEISEVTPDQFGEVQDLLKQILGQTKGVTPTYGDAATKLASEGAVLAIPGWFPLNAFSADAGSDTIRSVAIPGGAFSFTDAYAILPTAQNVDLAYAWINMGLDAKVNAEAANYLLGGTVSEPSVAFLSETVTELYDHGDIEATFAEAPLFALPPQESDTLVTYQQVLDGWQEAKAGA